ncbi:hypothetical protein [Streptomyces olivoreticuli]|uniref:hypothetical protein n=1 Tax=Streptomyces olivoreticuli TaxID=68246 RepID=UPI0013C37457|nr:hypothetical protein [Streptomyces olivoreticuli]
MVVNIPQLIFEAALKLMSNKSITPKEAVAQAKKNIPGAALIDTTAVEKKLQDHVDKQKKEEAALDDSVGMPVGEIDIPPVESTGD